MKFNSDEYKKYILSKRINTKLSALNLDEINYILANNYGPTENTVVATSYILTSVDGKRMPPIGKAISNTAIYLLDKYGL